MIGRDVTFIYQSSNPSFHTIQDYGISFKKVSSVLDYINSHLHEDLSLDHLAKKFYLSKNYLGKIFKKPPVIGWVGEYIISRRIIMAKQYLSVVAVSSPFVNSSAVMKIPSSVSVDKSRLSSYPQTVCMKYSTFFNSIIKYFFSESKSVKYVLNSSHTSREMSLVMFSSEMFSLWIFFGRTSAI